MYVVSSVNASTTKFVEVFSFGIASFWVPVDNGINFILIKPVKCSLGH